MNKILCTALLLSTMIACQPEKEVLIDNPSDEKISIQLDGDETISLEPWETKTIMVKFGNRQISVNDQPAEEIYLDKDNDYLLNPTKETYYIEKAIYFTSKREEKRYSENHYPPNSIVEGYEIAGDYKKIEGQLLIKKVWKFGLENGIAPSFQTRVNPLKGYLAVAKIHRKKDLSDFISNEFTKQMEAFIKERELNITE